ncbi:MAG: Hpt domain-containing protein [Fibrobacteria bacterium]|nr:Hpt domain-containing protein [Fibrobacteria bacterium]
MSEVDIEIFNRPQVLENLDGDEETLVEFCTDFVDELEGYMAPILEAISGGDGEALRMGAHTLKGVLGNFQANRSQKAAFALEEMGRSGDLSQVEPALATLKTELESLTAAMK